jgi:hypothetical protein
MEYAKVSSPLCIRLTLCSNWYAYLSSSSLTKIPRKPNQSNSWITDSSSSGVNPDS